MSEIVRTPTPFGRPSRILNDRRGLLRAMGLGAIGDIGSPSLTTTNVLTWETASDWDSAVDESGVVHENTSNSDHTDASVVKMGYPLGDPILSNSLADLWALNEDSGSTAYSFATGGRNGSVSGATLGATGLLGTSSYSFDGTDDYITIGSVSDSNVAGSSAFSFAAWVYHNGVTGTRDRMYNLRSTDISDSLMAITGSSEIWYRIIDDNNNQTELKGDSMPTGAWTLLSYSWSDSNGQEGYKNGTDITSNMTAKDNATAVQTGNDNEYLASTNGSGDFLNGDMTYVMTWTRKLSASEHQTLYDVVAADGYLLSATKSFSTASAPDLQNLSYSLNGQSISLDVIGSPGTASEEINTVTLDGSTSYDLTWSNTHTDFRLKPVFSTTDDTTTPTFNRGELIA